MFSRKLDINIRDLNWTVLTVRGTFTDETNAVSAVEIIPVGIMDKTSTVLAFFVAMGPVIRLARLPLPDSIHNNKLEQNTKCLLVTFTDLYIYCDSSFAGLLTWKQVTSHLPISRHFPPPCQSGPARNILFLQLRFSQIATERRTRDKTEDK